MAAARRPLWSAIFLLAVVAPAYAQVEPPLRRVEIDLGAGLIGGASLGSADANLRANAPARLPFRLFATDSRFAPEPDVHGRVGIALSRRLGVEGGVMYSRPRIKTSVSGDVEGAPALTVDERIDQYIIEATILFRLDEIRFGGRTVPYAAGGAGYLRQLHEGLTVVEHGHLYHLGGGVKHWLLARDRGPVRSAGVRADGRLYLMVGGASFDRRPRPHLAASGSVFFAF